MKHQDLLHVYNRRFTVPFSGETYAAAVDRDVRIIHHLTKDLTAPRICDLGCGRGIHIARLSETISNSVIGVDFSTSAEIAFRFRHGRDSKAQFIVSSAEAFSASSNEKFDIVMCNLPHLDARFETQAFSLLQSLRSLCTKNGFGVVSCFCHEYATGLVSNISACYDNSSQKPLHSETSYSAQTRILRITQNFEGWEEPLIEDMQLFSIGELESMLLKVGFHSVNRLPDLGLHPIAELQRIEESKITFVGKNG